MKFSALDVDGDFTFGNGLGNYVQGVDAVALNIKTNLLCFLGDCFFDAAKGIDWFNLLGSKNKAALLFSIRSVILGCQGVSSVQQVTADPEPDSNRNLSVSYDVTTTFGITISKTVIFPAAPFVAPNKYLKDFTFSGNTTLTVDTSMYIRDARDAVWILYDVNAGFSPVVGAVSPIDASHVLVTMIPGPYGVFRLVGVE